MAEWLYEAGIGEARAALVDDGRLIELAIEPEGAHHRAGAVLDARLIRAADQTRRGLVALESGGEALLIAPPRDLTEGARLRVEIVREALPEGGGLKPPHVRVVPRDQALREGPDLAARLAHSGTPLRTRHADADPFEAHGWSEALEEAATGLIARPEAMLRVSLTPAMTLIDVDGAGDPATLAQAGARLAGETIRRFGIAGSIGIDLPTMAARADRQAAAAALDAALPQPFERTAVNGFGFLQLVRRRERPSLPELLAADPLGAAARALLRRAERARGSGPVTITAAARVIALLETRPLWIAALAARLGVPIVLQAEDALAISAGHAQRLHP